MRQCHLILNNMVTYTAWNRIPRVHIMVNTFFIGKNDIIETRLLRENKHEVA